jgi:Lsr2
MVRFGVDGAEYEIDLSSKNAAAFRRKLAPFIDHAARPLLVPEPGQHSAPPWVQSAPDP